MAFVTTPEDAWERSIALPAIDRAFLDRAFAAIDPRLAEREWTVLAGGLRTVNLRSGDVVARVAMGQEADVQREAAVLRAVADRVCVPEVLAASDTTLLARFVPHGPLPASEQAGRAVGATAAAIHAIRFADAGIFDADLRVREPWSSAVDGLREHDDELLEGGAASRLGARARAIHALWARHDARMQDAARQPVLVHSDFKPTNVKWTADGRVLVLDWEFAWAGPALYDVGQLLRWDPPAPFVEGFALGYRDAGGTLPDGWRDTAMLFDLFNMVSFASDATDRPIRDRDVLARIDRALAHLDR
jgi:aminoglycoside phosphotransferase (APT) family kinase protein